MGVDGPAGTGVVAFGALPFDRNATGTLCVPEFVVTQFASGETWLTTPSSHDAWRELYDAVVAPTQETQRPTQ